MRQTISQQTEGFGKILTCVLLLVAFVLDTTQARALSPREREILTADLGPSRMAMFVGGIPDVEDVGVFRPVKIPAKFSAYDVNPKDGFISLMELTSASEAEEGARSVFKSTDTNFDGRISILEFMRAPWKLRP